jgi:hypothetical protein
LAQLVVSAEVRVPLQLLLVEARDVVDEEVTV